MSLNIKSRETHELATKVAELAGETLTEAVTTALRERLHRLTKPSPEDLLAIGRECAAHLSSKTLGIDHGEYLYDEKGLPR